MHLKSQDKNFDGGWKSPVRMYSDDTFVWRIRPPINQGINQVKFYTNLGSENGTYHTILLVQNKEGYFEWQQPAMRVGVYGLRVVFVTNNSEIFERDLPTRVIIDPATLRQLSVYTLIPRASGSIRSWRGWIEHAKSMGFNALHLLPVTLPGPSGSPYAAADLFSLDPAYLTSRGIRAPWAEWAKLVEFLKKEGVKLCIDLVLNHVAVDSHLCKHQKYLFIADPTEPDGIKRAGWWGDTWNKWDDLALLNYRNEDLEARLELWEIMRDYALLWAEAAQLTGGYLRLDNFHSSDPFFMRYLLACLRRRYPELGIFTEFFAEPALVARKSLSLGLNLQLATPWEEKFVPGVRGLFAYLHSEYPRQRFFTPINSHDSGSPAQEFGVSRSIYPRYALSTLGGMGVTGMVQGVEFGIRNKLEFLPDLDKNEPTHEDDYSQYISRINRLFFNYPRFFARAGNFILADQGHNAIIAFYRTCPEEPQHPFLIVLNFDTHHSQELVITSLPAGFNQPRRLRDRLHSRDLLFPEFPWKIELEPCQISIYQFA